MSTRGFVGKADPTGIRSGDFDARWDDGGDLERALDEREAWRDHRERERERDTRGTAPRGKPHRGGRHGCDRKRGHGTRRRID